MAVDELNQADAEIEACKAILAPCESMDIEVLREIFPAVNAYGQPFQIEAIPLGPAPDENGCRKTRFQFSYTIDKSTGPLIQL